MYKEELYKDKNEALARVEELRKIKNIKFFKSPEFNVCYWFGEARYPIHYSIETA